MKKFMAGLVVAITAVAVAGCGGGSHKTVKSLGISKPSATLLQSVCPAGNSHMGCSVHPPKGLGGPLVKGPSSGSLFPDVSSWQGNVNWPAVLAWQRSHGYKQGAIFKMGEYGVDPFAARNASELHRLGAIAVGYWFVRNTGCAHEAQQIVSEAHSLSITHVDEDIETPEGRGYDGCLTPTLKRAGLTVSEYTSPGAYPGGNGGPGNPTWIAAYGPSNPPASPWGSKVLAWQFTDGTWGGPVNIPGIGKDDVSVDYGLLSLGTKPPPPPKPKPPVKDWEAAKAHAFIAYHNVGCKFPQQSQNCTNLGETVKTYQTKLWDAGKVQGGEDRWHCWGKSAPTTSRICWIVRPQVSYWSGARHASQNRAGELNCGGLTGQQVDKRKECQLMVQREKYFTAKINSTMKAF